MIFLGVSSLDNEESKYSYHPNKDMELLGGSPMRKKNGTDDRRKSTLNIIGAAMKNKLDANKKNMAKR